MKWLFGSKNHEEYNEVSNPDLNALPRELSDATKAFLKDLGEELPPSPKGYKYKIVKCRTCDGKGYKRVEIMRSEEHGEYSPRTFYYPTGRYENVICSNCSGKKKVKYKTGYIY